LIIVHTGLFLLFLKNLLTSLVSVFIVFWLGKSINFKYHVCMRL